MKLYYVRFSITSRSIAKWFIDCEQSLFFFRFSRGSAHARVPLPSRAISLARGHSRVSRFARRTTEKRETARSLNGLGRNLVRKLLSSYFFTLINEETDDFQALADIIFRHNLRAFLTWIESVSLNDCNFFCGWPAGNRCVTIRSVQIIVGCFRGW